MHITASYTITLTEKEWKTIQEILDETNTDTTCSAMTLATSLRQKHGKYDDRVRNYSSKVATCIFGHINTMDSCSSYC